MNNILLPSLLSADFYRLGESIKTVEDAGCTHLHVDVMDGVFVPNYAIGIPVIKAIDKNCNQVLDCHLMVVDPGRYINEFVEAGADYITIHLEATDNAKADLIKIREAGVKAGLSIKPGTPVETLYPFMDEKLVDLILIMSVEPGFGGQGFIPESLDKIKAVKKYADKIGLDVDIEVDGGVGKANIEEINKAGANMLVAGSAVFKNDAALNFKELNSIINK